MERMHLMQSVGISRQSLPHHDLNRASFVTNRAIFVMGCSNLGDGEVEPNPGHIKRGFQSR